MAIKPKSKARKHIREAEKREQTQQERDYFKRKSEGGYASSKLDTKYARERQYAYDEIIELLNMSQSREATSLLNLFSWVGMNDQNKLEDFILVFTTVVGEDGYKHLEQAVFDSGAEAYNAYASLMTDLIYYAGTELGYNSEELESMENFAAFGGAFH